MEQESLGKWLMHTEVPGSLEAFVMRGQLPDKSQVGWVAWHGGGVLARAGCSSLQCGYGVLFSRISGGVNGVATWSHGKRHPPVRRTQAHYRFDRLASTDTAACMGCTGMKSHMHQLLTANGAKRLSASRSKHGLRTCCLPQMPQAHIGRLADGRGSFITSLKCVSCAPSGARGRPAGRCAVARVLSAAAERQAPSLGCATLTTRTLTLNGKLSSLGRCATAGMKPAWPSCHCSQGRTPRII